MTIPTDWSAFASSLFYDSEFDMWFDLYVTHQNSLSQLAEKLGYSSATILARLELYNIPKRSRGGANNKARIGRILHLMDQRVVFSTKSKTLAKKLKANFTSIWKYKRQEKS